METIRACSILRENGFNVELICVGDGECRKDAENIVKILNLQEEVSFTGYIPEKEVNEIFFDTDIFVFPTSHSEGFPNVLFKAATAGMPIVTTKVRAAAEYLREPENCLFCTKEPEDIANKIIELLGNTELRQTMRQCNLEFNKLLLPENIAHEFLSIYRKILNK